MAIRLSSQIEEGMWSILAFIAVHKPRNLLDRKGRRTSILEMIELAPADRGFLISYRWR